MVRNCDKRYKLFHLILIWSFWYFLFNKKFHYEFWNDNNSVLAINRKIYVIIIYFFQLSSLSRSCDGFLSISKKKVKKTKEKKKTNRIVIIIIFVKHYLIGVVLYISIYLTRIFIHFLLCCFLSFLKNLKFLLLNNLNNFSCFFL